MHIFLSIVNDMGNFFHVILTECIIFDLELTECTLKHFFGDFKKLFNKGAEYGHKNDRDLT